MRSEYKSIDVYESIKIFVGSIEDAINKKCYLPALAMTLIIPDVCAHFCYPEIYNGKKNGNGEGAAYEKWYDEYIGKYEMPKDIPDDESKIIFDKTKFTGRYCWKLRCSFLHNASIDIDKCFNSNDDEDDIEFLFSVSKYSGSIASEVSYYKELKKIIIKMDIVTFCYKILSVFKNSYLNNKDFLQWLEKKQVCLFKLDVDNS